MKNRLENMSENFSIFTSIIVGLLGVIIGIADLFEWKLPLINVSKGPLSFILITVGFLSLGMGLERIIRFRRMDEQIQKIEQIIEKSSGGKHLRGSNEIYGASIRLLNEVQNQIRAIIYTNVPRAPEKWLETIIRRLKETKRSGSFARFVQVFALDINQISDEFNEKINQRIRLYEKNGVGNLVSISLVDMKSPVGFDVLILDRNHVLIGFTKFSGADQLQSAILFENQPHIADEFADWFDKVILPSVNKKIYPI